MGLYVSLPRCLDLYSDDRAILATKTEFNGKTEVNQENERFPDLADLPPELGLAVLSHLNATDLCLAACVWNDLAHDEMLWMGLCKSKWGYSSIYHAAGNPLKSYRKIYLQLDEGSLTFCADADMGMEYFFKYGLIRNDPKEIARFFHCTEHLNSQQMQNYLDKRGDVLEHLISLQNFNNQFLPNALRTLLSRTLAPNDHGNYLHVLLEKFSRRFCDCNQHLELLPDTVYIVSFSLIMLSVDLASPHVKNKMSKREFIRNVRRAVGHRIDDEWCGHMYDNVYLRGHVAPLFFLYVSWF